MLSSQTARDPDGPPDDPARFGKDWAADYDAFESADSELVQKQAAVLAELAGSGSVLEVAAGTGRVTLPLAEHGLAVTATDASLDLLAILEQKDTEHLVQMNVDILPGIGGDETYSLICILLNSIWVMTSAEEQREFFRNAFAHLQPHGKLVVDMGVANPQKWVETARFPKGDRTMIRASVWSPASQRILHTFSFEDASGKYIEARESLLRIVFPEELRLMAELTGFQMSEMWEDWSKTPFTAKSKWCIAIFERPA